MPVYRWKPTATNVKEKVVVTIGATVIRVRSTIAGIIVTGDVGANCVAAVENFIAAISAANHYYHNQYKYTWSGSTSGGTLTLEAREAGVPVSDTGASPVEVFIAAWSGYTGSFTTASGRCWVNDVKNWRDSTGAVPESIPTAGDTVLIDDTGDGLLWGWEGMRTNPYEIDWLKCYIGENFNGAFGMNPNRMTRTYDGRQVVDAPEYRTTYTNIIFRSNTVLEIRGNPIRFCAALNHVNDTDLLKIDALTTTPQTGMVGAITITLDDTTLGAAKSPNYQINNGSVAFYSQCSANRYLRPYLVQAGGRTRLVGSETTAPASAQFNVIQVNGGELTLDGLSIIAAQVRGSAILYSRVSLVRSYIYLYGGVLDLRGELLADYSAALLYCVGGRLRSVLGGLRNAFSAMQIETLNNEDELALELSNQFYGDLAQNNTPEGRMELTIR